MRSSRACVFAAAMTVWVSSPAIAFERIDSSPTDQVRQLTFELDVMPVLTAAGCNQGACHGKSRGQNGFQLSLLGFDPEFDFAAIAKAGRGRRVFPAAPDQSLLLAKASARMSHGGGLRLAEDGENYHILRQWIADGMPRNPVDGPTLAEIIITPAESPLTLEANRQLLVNARYSDGVMRDVTRMCAFQSSEPAVATIDDKGLIQAGKLPGEASIMIRYMGRIVSWNVVIPREARFPADQYANLPRNNYIDDHVWHKLEQVGVLPSAPVTDSTFLRRVHLDVIGRLPGGRRSARLSGRSVARQTNSPDRQALGKSRVCRLLGQSLGRSAAAQSLSGGDQGHVEFRRLDSRCVPTQPALRPMGTQPDYGARQHLAERRRHVVSRPTHAGRNHADGRPVVPGGSHRLRSLPPSPV